MKPITHQCKSVEPNKNKKEEEPRLSCVKAVVRLIDRKPTLAPTTTRESAGPTAGSGSRDTQQIPDATDTIVVCFRDRMLPAALSVAHHSARIVAPAARAVVGGIVVQSVVNKFVAKSVRCRLDAKIASNDIAAIQKTRGFLKTELQRKQCSFRQCVPLLILTLAVGDIAVRNDPLTRSWNLYSPSYAVIGVEFCFLAFFNALDNIQDEVAPLGPAPIRELVVLSMGCIATMLFLVRSNKAYHVKAVSILLGTYLGKTQDTPLWKLFAPFCIILLAASILLGQMGSTGAVGPAFPVVGAITAVLSLTNLLYENLTAAGNPWRAPRWLVKAAESSILHCAALWSITLTGLYPVGWIPREVLNYVFYYVLKIHQHATNLGLVLSAGNEPLVESTPKLRKTPN